MYTCFYTIIYDDSIKTCKTKPENGVLSGGRSERWWIAQVSRDFRDVMIRDIGIKRLAEGAVSSGLVGQESFELNIEFKAPRVVREFRDAVFEAVGFGNHSLLTLDTEGVGTSDLKLVWVRG